MITLNPVTLGKRLHMALRVLRGDYDKVGFTANEAKPAYVVMRTSPGTYAPTSTNIKLH